ncbi:MAG: DUF721 domain-containing protein [Gaiellaceae bacterium]
MERIGDEVSRTLGRSGDGAALVLAEITAAWASAVGDAIARQAWPLRVGRDGTLHVATTSATWAFELDRMAAEITERLATVLGSSAPQALRFRPGPVPEPGPAAGGSSPPESVPRATPQESAAADEAASTIDDPELRALAARAIRASLARARSDLEI